MGRTDPQASDARLVRLRKPPTLTAGSREASSETSARRTALLAIPSVVPGLAKLVSPHGNSIHARVPSPPAQYPLRCVLPNCLGGTHCGAGETVQVLAARCLAMLVEGQPEALNAVGEARAIPYLLQLAHGPLGVPARWADDESVRASEAGLEALWALSFGNRANIGELKAEGAPSHLVDIAETTPSPVARMWALGVLHRLSRDYCDGESHSCHSTSGTVTLSTKNLRESLAQDSRVIREAVRAVSLGPARLGPSNLVGKLIAGGHLVLEAPRHHRQGLEAWAGAALLRSLALDPGCHASILAAGGVVALVRLSGSEDHLESSQAKGALRLLALTITL